MAKQCYPFEDPNVADAFEKFPAKERKGLMALRALIFDVAQETPGVGEIFETLKWSQPAYLTPETKSGTTIRLGVPQEGVLGLYTHCQTTVMSDFQILFPDDFDYEGNRAVYLRSGSKIPKDKIEILIRRALTYHQ